jgi:hypothetical protein
MGGAAPSGLGERFARKLSGVDNDVVDLAEIEGVDLSFAADSSTRLAVTARIEPAVLGTEPAAYPAANVYRPVAEFRSFYRYRVGSLPWQPRIDGSLEGESLGMPLFAENLTLGSGHPESPTWAWVGDDGSTLYALLDVTSDNTLDGGADYARLHVKTPGGLRTFGVTTADTRWGRAGFEYTDRVGWEHKVYEIAVPLAEIGVVTGTELEIAFTMYGTVSTQLNFSTDVNGVDPDSAPSGSTFTFTVKYWGVGSNDEPLRTDLWIDLDGDGQQDARSPIFTDLGGSWPWIGAIALLVAMLLVAGHRRSLPRLAALAVALVALSTCRLPMTRQEIYPMTGSGTDWVAGVVFTAEVPLVRDPGAYEFMFLFENYLSIPVSGPAAGVLELTIE